MYIADVADGGTGGRRIIKNMYGNAVLSLWKVVKVAPQSKYPTAFFTSLQTIVKRKLKR